MQKSTKGNLKESAKVGFKTATNFTFLMFYWLFFGTFIFIGFIMEGIGLAIVLTILFGFGYWLSKKLAKLIFKSMRGERK